MYLHNFISGCPKFKLPILFRILNQFIHIWFRYALIDSESIILNNTLHAGFGPLSGGTDVYAVVWADTDTDGDNEYVTTARASSGSETKVDGDVEIDIDRFSYEYNWQLSLSGEYNHCLHIVIVQKIKYNNPAGILFV